MVGIEWWLFFSWFRNFALGLCWNMREGDFPCLSLWTGRVRIFALSHKENRYHQLPEIPLNLKTCWGRLQMSKLCLLDAHSSLPRDCRLHCWPWCEVLTVLSPMCSSCSIFSLSPRYRRIDLPDLGGWSPSKTVKPLWGKGVIVDLFQSRIPWECRNI